MGEAPSLNTGEEGARELATPAHAAPGSGPRVKRLRRVLLVEDNSDAGEALREILEDSGHSVEFVTDGYRGIERALAWRPDVSLVDIGLPGLDGYEVARRIRAADGKALFLVALTGYSGSEQKQQAMEAGFDLHLVKPVDPDELMKVLDQVPERS